MKKIQSWGRLSASEHEMIYLSSMPKIAAQLMTKKSCLAFGMGRSYGDVCLNPNGALLYTRSLDKFLDFNEQTGRLTCQSGVLLRDIQQLLVPRGWSLAVTPGTLLLTVGGAIANDVHGKNHHHFGTFGEHIRWLRLLRTDGQVIECGPDLNPAWFAATVGGVGLTGLILEVELQLRQIQTPWLETELIPFSTPKAFFSLSEASIKDWEFTVAWVDCTRAARGIFLRANWSHRSVLYSPSRQIAIPNIMPFSLVNQMTLKPLNHLYYYLKKRQAGAALVHYEQFLYPLDRLSGWNHLYGPNGFYQYQVVLAHESGHEALVEMLLAIEKSRQGSSLAVLKTFAEREKVGMMSFVKPGVTLALDFPNRGMDTLKLLTRLDAIAEAANGRIYLAKDATMSYRFFEKSYPLLNEFIQYRDLRMSSGLSRRLGMG